jgi:hypothetical protein
MNPDLTLSQAEDEIKRLKAIRGYCGTRGRLAYKLNGHVIRKSVESSG